MIVRKLLISVATFGLIAATPALASSPTPLGASGGRGGSLSKNSDTAEDGAKFDCYAVETKPGEDVELTVKSSSFTPEVWVARGATCESMAVQAQSEPGKSGEASVKFKAAGGRYLVMTRASGAKQSGTYRIVVMHASEFKAQAAEAGTPADGGRTADGDSATSGGDRRVALMKKQVAVRQMQLAEDARIAAAAAAAERKRQQALAEQRRRQAEAEAQQSEEGGIFGRALGGFLMGAMLGGGGEGSMDMAIAGAQAAAQGGNALEVINSIGSAVPGGGGGGAGATGGSMASSMSTAPVMPNTIGGSCPGMNEGNYRQVAVAGGGDTQMKSMCGLAYEHYNSYKNSVAQGYSAADQQLAYDVYQKSNQALQQFQSEAGSSSGGIQQDTHGYQAPAPVQSTNAGDTTVDTCDHSGPGSCVTPQ
ncbi:MAG: hypothetical protein ABIO29_00185 [Sphingomicrobium sp.]